MTNRSHNSVAVFISASLLIVIGGSTFNIMPFLTAGAADTLGYSNAQVGVMS